MLESSLIVKHFLPSPKSNGYLAEEEGPLHPNWSYDAILSDKLVNIVTDIQVYSSDVEDTAIDCSFSESFHTDSEGEDRG